MTITLQDIAKASGVSKATVSRVLNNDPRISERTRVNVREVMGRLGYQLPQRASALRSGNIAFLVADPSGTIHEDLFFNEVLLGVVEQIEPRGFHALVSPSDGMFHAESGLPPVMSRADGVIAGGAQLGGALVRALIEGPLPAVLIGRYLRGRGMNAVLPDNEEGGRLATEHLLKLGRRRIAFFGGPAASNIYRDRRAGFEQAHEEAGLRWDPALMQLAERTPQGGLEAMQRLLDLLGPQQYPDAVFASDDWIAIGALRALRQRGLRIPDDVAVIGYSDIALASIADPPLSTIHVPKRRLGRTAAKLLLDLLDGELEGPVQIVVSPSLVVRESTVAGGGVVGGG
jgi:DNA-binding LacI/PurR family transcriptional regulator